MWVNTVQRALDAEEAGLGFHHLNKVLQTMHKDIPRVGAFSMFILELWSAGLAPDSPLLTDVGLETLSRCVTLSTQRRK